MPAQATALYYRFAMAPPSLELSTTSPVASSRWPSASGNDAVAGRSHLRKSLPRLTMVPRILPRFFSGLWSHDMKGSTRSGGQLSGADALVK